MIDGKRMAGHLATTDRNAILILMRVGLSLTEGTMIQRFASSKGHIAASQARGAAHDLAAAAG
jgi:hypothetical protein